MVYKNCTTCARVNGTCFRCCEHCREYFRRYGSSAKGQSRDRRYNKSAAGRAAQVRYKVKGSVLDTQRSLGFHGRRLSAIQIFLKLTGMTEEQLNFPRR